MQALSLQGLTVASFCKQLWNRFFDDDITSTSAQLSYYLLFSLFPFLVFLLALLPLLDNYLPIRDAIDNAMDTLSRIMPPQGMVLIQERWKLQNFASKPEIKLLYSGLFGAVWFASRGTDAFRAGLNRILRIQETRNYIRLQIMEILLTMAMVGSLLFAFVAIVLGGKFGIWLSAKLHISNIFFLWLRWPVSTLLVITSLNVLYFALPNGKKKFHFIDLGSIVATVLWLAFTWGFTKYVENFGNYNVIYGSIGSVIVLMTWFYLSGILFFLGAEINAIVQTVSSSPSKQMPV